MPELAVPLRGRSDHDPGTAGTVSQPSARQASPRVVFHKQNPSLQHFHHFGVCCMEKYLDNAQELRLPQFEPSQQQDRHSAWVLLAKPRSREAPTQSASAEIIIDGP